MTDGGRAAPALTVVVMGYRNEATILAAIDSVLSQVSAEPFDVVVVTSGDDRSGALVRERHPELRLVAAPDRHLPGGARNLGVAAARGEFVAFLAADCVAMPGWVDGRIRRHRAGADAVAAAMTITGPARRASWAHLYLLFGARLPGRPAGAVTPPDPAVHGLSYSRALLDRLGPFDESVVVGEDTDAAMRLAALDAEVWFEPTVVIGHPGPGRMTELLVDMRRRSAAVHDVADAEPAPPTSRARVARVALYRLRMNLEWTALHVRSFAAPGAPGLWSLAPWLLAGAVGRQLGWAEAQWRRRRTPM